AVYKQIVQLVNQTYTAIAYKYAKARLVNNRFLPRAVRQDIDRLITTLNRKIESLLKQGVIQAWHLAEEKNAIIETQATGGGNKKPPLKTTLTAPAAPDFNMITKKFGGGSTKALKSFINGETTKHSLSKNVWKQSPYYRKYINTTLADAIKTGASARDTAKRLIDAEYRPKDAKDPRGQGQGVYKDPKKNALRLTRHTINTSYTTADHNRWKTQWFVIGYKVQVSHKQRKYDVCDEMAGEYPKDFKFNKWHVQCVCFATPILASQKDRDNYDLYRLGKIKEPPEIKYITDIPESAKAWVEKNRKRIDGWKSKPDFLLDNGAYFE
ncbi:MAG: hypothetical protein ACTHLB_05520, partial [Parafilimonas sp.]